MVLQKTETKVKHKKDKGALEHAVYGFERLSVFYLYRSGIVFEADQLWFFKRSER